MTGALQSIGGNDADLQLAEHMRSMLASPLYKDAGGAQVPADDALKSLLGRPFLKDAWSRAQTLAENAGDKLVTGKDIPEHVVNSKILNSSGDTFATTVPEQVQNYSGKALQYLKMSLNDMLSTAPQQGIGSHEQGALKSTLGSLNDWTMANIPQLRAADRAFSELSQPINQMQIGRALSDKLIPALGDFGNNTRLTAGSYANALRNSDKLAATATNFPAATLENTLRPDQLRTVMQVGQQLARRANADELGRAVGSNTGQNLASQNVLRSFLGPLGLPQGMADMAARSAIGQTVMRPIQWALSAGEPGVQNVLAEAALNPDLARQLLIQQQMARIPWRPQVGGGSIPVGGLAGLIGERMAAYVTQ
jgi:hypothetical protein